MKKQPPKASSGRMTKMKTLFFVVALLFPLGLFAQEKERVDPQTNQSPEEIRETITGLTEQIQKLETTQKVVVEQNAEAKVEAERQTRELREQLTAATGKLSEMLKRQDEQAATAADFEAKARKDSVFQTRLIVGAIVVALLIVGIVMWHSNKKKSRDTTAQLKPVSASDQTHESMLEDPTQIQIREYAERYATNNVAFVLILEKDLKFVCNARIKLNNVIVVSIDGDPDKREMVWDKRKKYAREVSHLAMKI